MKKNNINSVKQTSQTQNIAMTVEQTEAAAIAKASKDFNSKLHTTGQIWTAIALVIMAMIPILFSIILGTGPDWALFFSCMALLIYYMPIGVVEVLTYSYMLGINGTYLAFVTGNLSNLKIPCVINAVNIVGTEVGTEEHEIACTVSIAISAIVTTLTIGIGVLCLAFSGLQQLLESPQAQFLTPAFGTVAFALFGALGGKYLVKNPKIALIPFIIMVTLCVGLTLGGLSSVVQPSYFIFVGVIACLINAIVLDKNKKKKAKAAELSSLNTIGEQTSLSFNKVAEKATTDYTKNKTTTENEPAKDKTKDSNEKE